MQAGECALLGNSISESVLKKVLKFLLHYTDETRENVGGSSQVSLIPDGMGFHGTPIPVMNGPCFVSGQMVCPVEFAEEGKYDLAQPLIDECHARFLFLAEDMRSTQLPSISNMGYLVRA